VKKIAAVILAAGQSKRMGQPKMLLAWGGTTVLGQVIATFAGAGVNEIVIVTGGAFTEVENEAKLLEKKYPLRCVYNSLFESGEMLSSLQCGLAALGTQIEAALLGLGDQPQLSPMAASAVISSFQTSAAQIIVPSYNMRRGHPWLVQRNLWESLLALKPPQTVRDFLNSRAGDILYIDTDQTILKDLDTPEEYYRDKP
jgi:molybdenum cofactor cytidylyltransferase